MSGEPQKQSQATGPVFDLIASMRRIGELLLPPLSDCHATLGQIRRDSISIGGTSRTGFYTGLLGLGLHFVQWLERSEAAGVAGVNPDHLTIGTVRMNNDQSWERDRKRAVSRLSRSDVLDIRHSHHTQAVL